jgi:hypothetical protein
MPHPQRVVRDLCPTRVEYVFGELSTRQICEILLTGIEQSKVSKVTFIVFLCSIISFITVNYASRIHQRQPFFLLFFICVR